jgi:arylsulfatase A-like enzyme
MDRSIGKILKALDDLGLRDDTLVIFTSDNGSLFSNGPLRANKGHLYEGGIRVPWAVRWPGKIKAGAVSDTPITTTDVFPTVMEAAGLQPKEGVPLDCESLLPVLTGSGGLSRDAIYFHYPNYAFHKRNRLGSAIRNGRHKLIHFYDDDSVELYDLKSDPGERHDLAQEKPALAATLRKQLSEWLKTTGARMPYQPESQD